MQTLHSTETRQQASAPTFTPLAHETRPAVDTAAAAYYLSRKPQTLRGWACLENGPLRPIRICGRLAWNVADIRRLLGVA
jgi:hypothetical protein